MAQLALIATVAGQAFSALSDFQAGQFNKSVAERNAQLAQEKAEADATQFAKAARARRGQQRANIAASGIGFEGSPLDIISQQAAEDEISRMNILRGGAISKAASLAEAGQFGREAGQELIGGGFGVASSILARNRVPGGGSKLPPLSGPAPPGIVP